MAEIINKEKFPLYEGNTPPPSTASLRGIQQSKLGRLHSSYLDTNTTLNNNISIKYKLPTHVYTVIFEHKYCKLHYYY